MLSNKQVKLDKKSKTIESSLNELFLDLQKNKDNLERANQLSSKKRVWLCKNSANVETNQISIVNHGFKTGDKVFYDGSATGLSTGTYFVNRVSSSIFQLSETIEDNRANPVRIVNITANTGGSQSVGLINPRIDVVKNSKLNFGLTSSTLLNFDFKLFYDKELTNEYLSSQDSSTF